MCIFSYTNNFQNIIDRQKLNIKDHILETNKL